MKIKYVDKHGKPICVGDTVIRGLGWKPETVGKNEYGWYKENDVYGRTELATCNFDYEGADNQLILEIVQKGE